MRTTRLLGFSLLAATAALVPFSARAYLATGGDSTSHFDQYAIHKFMTPGTHTFTPSEPVTVDVLLVGGGGGGGCSGGGGGGAGQVVVVSNAVLQSGVEYTVVVGAGGVNTAFTGVAEYDHLRGTRGGDSAFGTFDGESVFTGTTALGGGGGGSWKKATGEASANSGGSSIWAHTPVASTLAEGGHAGGAANGAAMGGGAGAGGDGESCFIYDQPFSGAGGPGVLVDFDGVPTWYAAGGGGGGNTGEKGLIAPGMGGSGIGGDGAVFNNGTRGGNGAPGTGSGGGGGTGCGGDKGEIITLGGDGGDGVVMIRYADSFTETANPLLGTPNVVDIRPSSATSSLLVLSPGLGADACDVFFTFGLVEGVFSQTVPLGSAAAMERVSEPIAGFAPGRFYYAKYYATTAGGGYAETPVFTFTTAAESVSSVNNPYAGLIQARQDDTDVTFDIATATNTAHVLGTVMANVNHYARYLNPLDGLTYSWPMVWNDPPITFAYWGYMYFDASKTYTFGFYVDEYADLYIDNDRVAERCGNWTTRDYTPPSTGWHEIRIYIPGGSYDKGVRGKAGSLTTWDNTLGLAFNTDGIKSAMPQTAWTPIVDSGDGTLLSIAVGYRSVSMPNWAYAGGEFSASLLFGDSATLDATLVACYGETWGGDDVSAWDVTVPLGSTVATTDASREVSGLAIPATARYVRFALEFPAASGLAAAWSETAALVEASLPALVSTGAADVDGDVATLTGTLTAIGTGADSATVSVEYGPVGGAKQTAVVGVYAVPSDFSYTLTGLDPASEYEFRFLASNTAGGAAATLDETFTTLAGSELVPSVSCTLAQQTATLAGTMGTLGAGVTTVTLLLGPDVDSMVPYDSKVVTSAGLFTFEEPVCFSNSYAFAFVSTNSCAGVTWDSATNPGTFEVPDKITYYWNFGEGNWEDTAQWRCYETYERIGYPTFGATAEFQSKATNSIVHINQPERFKELVLDGGEHDILFVSDSTNNLVRCDEQSNWNGHVHVAFDNVGLRVGGNAFLGAFGTWEMRNGSDLYIGKTFNCINSNSVYRIADGSHVTAMEAIRCDCGTLFEIDDARVDCFGGFLLDLDDPAKEDVPVKVRFAGTHPELRAGKTFMCYASNRQSPTLEFDIPEGGYATVPLASAEGNKKRLGNVEWPNSNVPIVVVVDPDSRVTRGAKSVNQLLIDWPNGIKTEDFVFGDLPNPDTDYFYWMPADREEGVEPTQLWVHVQATGGSTLILLR